MGASSIPPVEQARSIFTSLGYTVSGDGTELRAERDWKVVRVTATTNADERPNSGAGELHCFVTYHEHGSLLRRRLRRTDPDCEWAVIAVGDDDEYDVLRAPPSGC